ncbi:MAG: hypothetical protein ACXQT5_06320 [Candidatus Syntropharchaeia archaeon]
MNVICFDLEGPLSPQDNAYEVMSLIENGEKIFEVISKYDDVISLQGREGYEPGDTLALIVPFLLFHGIREEDIKKVSDRAGIVDGASDLILMLSEEWNVFIVSTSYEQHAHNIGRKLGIPEENVYCTRLKLEELRRKMGEEDFLLVEKVEREMVNLPEKDVVSRLDRFFFEELSFDVFGIGVIGGERKVEAVKMIAEREKKRLNEIMVVGDSITDYKMLKRIKDEGGISVVFNGNEYAVPHGSVGLASESIFPLHLICEFFPEVHRVVKEWEKRGDSFKNRPYSVPDHLITPELRDFILKNKEFHFQDLENADEEKIEEVIKIHKKYRKIVRGKAAKLG